MAAKGSIISAIEAKAKAVTYRNWRIGLTHDPAERKKYWTETEKENTTAWSQWQADSLSDAEDIEVHFISKGMKGGPGGDLSPKRAVHVYVF